MNQPTLCPCCQKPIRGLGQFWTVWAEAGALVFCSIECRRLVTHGS